MGHVGLDQKYDIVILGAGGHASVLIDILKGQTDLKICLVDNDLDKAEQNLLDCPIVGTDDDLENVTAKYFIVGLGSVRATENDLRATLYDRAISLGFEPYTLVSKKSYVSDYSKIGAGTVVFPRAIVNTNTVIEGNVIVNSGAIIEHDCHIHNHAHICPGATLSGQVVVHEKSLVGANATIRQSVAIGKGATIGAASLILSDVSDFVTKVGSPAHLL